MRISGKAIMENGKFMMVLMNTKNNAEKMKGSPHYDFLDLTVGYQVVLHDKEADTFITAPVSFEMMEAFQLTESELHERALRDMEKYYPVEMNDDFGVFLVITNKSLFYGAGAVLIDGTLKKIAEKMNGDYFLIPSSKHELLAVSAELDSEYLLSTINSVNNTVINENDILSYNLYRYNSRDEQIEIVEK